MCIYTKIVTILFRIFSLIRVLKPKDLNKHTEERDGPVVYNIMPIPILVDWCDKNDFQASRKDSLQGFSIYDSKRQLKVSVHSFSRVAWIAFIPDENELSSFMIFLKYLKVDRIEDKMRAW